MNPFHRRIILAAALGVVAILSHGTAGFAIPSPAASMARPGSTPEPTKAIP
ncbi:hypothetical protein ACW73L_08810 [Methylolobus aquaticus]